MSRTRAGASLHLRGPRRFRQRRLHPLFLERLNPRHARSVALSKPTEAERGQWYFQRYVAHLPTAGDMCCSIAPGTTGPASSGSWTSARRSRGAFLRDAPDFEALLVRDGIHLFKFYLVIGREMQLQRFHERRHDPFKRWKITDSILPPSTSGTTTPRAERNLQPTSTKNRRGWSGARQRSAACAARGDPLGAFQFDYPTRTQAPSARLIPRSSAPARNISNRRDGLGAVS